MSDTLQGADFSEDGVYLYKRWHKWGDQPGAVFCLINPPFPDKDHNEPVMQKCEHFARSWGCGGVEIVHLFALVTCLLKELHDSKDPVGPRNDQTILESAKAAQVFVAAWKCFGVAQARIVAVEKMLQTAGVKIMCLGTLRGYPMYPFFAEENAKPVPYARTKDFKELNT